jgi:hypothetical protein
MILNAAKAAFLPESEQDRLADWFGAALSKYLSGSNPDITSGKSGEL